jgi:A/G-specific adenine glycosylase
MHKELKERLRNALVPWFEGVKSARGMPWREAASRVSPYGVWVSETMLQQTRARTVIPYWERFVRELPDVQSLAEAPLDHVLSLWSGLGYYRRARMLHAAAQRVVREYDGRIPDDPEALARLEGVGAYTAAALASIAFGKRAPAVDGNIARVLARIFAIKDDVSSGPGKAAVWKTAGELMPSPEECDPGTWNQALMELGATVCTPRRPSCDECPAGAVCEARTRGIAAVLPQKAAKKPPRTVRLVALVLESREGVLLARRREGELFGGLWEPPAVEGDPEQHGLAGGLAARLGVPQTRLRAAGEVVHVLSHRRLVVSVSHGSLAGLSRRGNRSWPLPSEEYDRVEWVPVDCNYSPLAKRPYSSLARKIVAMALQR